MMTNICAIALLFGVVLVCVLVFEHLASRSKCPHCPEQFKGTNADVMLLVHLTETHPNETATIAQLRAYLHERNK